MRKTFDYDTIEIGEVLGRKEVLITQEMVATCAHSIESTHPWYTWRFAVRRADRAANDF